MKPFDALLKRFVVAVEANDGDGFAALFTADGAYDDYFFGEHRGRASIAAMLARFHEGGERYRWEFFEPLSDGRTGYARYRFSYVSKVPDSQGKTIGFEGISRFVLEDGLIAHYAEVFDRGAAFVQLGFPAGKVARLLEKYTESQRLAPGWREHLADREKEKGV